MLQLPNYSVEELSYKPRKVEFVCLIVSFFESAFPDIAQTGLELCVAQAGLNLRQAVISCISLPNPEGLLFYLVFFQCFVWLSSMSLVIFKKINRIQCIIFRKYKRSFIKFYKCICGICICMVGSKSTLKCTRAFCSQEKLPKIYVLIIFLFFIYFIYCGGRYWESNSGPYAARQTLLLTYIPKRLKFTS